MSDNSTKATKIELVQGDITKIQVEAIVNAANSSLLGGGGVDGAIHRAAGPELLKECKKLNGCKTGEAKITKGYNLPAKFVVHTVGPIYGQEQGKEKELLANCYLNSLKIAMQHGIKSLAFPAISTGVYRYPKDKAAAIATKAVKDFLANNPNHNFEKIVFVVFSKLDYEIYRKLIGQS